MTRSLFLTSDIYFKRQAAELQAERLLNLGHDKAKVALTALLIDLAEFQKLDPCRISMKAHLAARNSGVGN